MAKQVTKTTCEGRMRGSKTVCLTRVLALCELEEASSSLYIRILHVFSLNCCIKAVPHATCINSHVLKLQTL